jgi:RNA polymerase sigma-70 factor (ECF subfamily)
MPDQANWLTDRFEQHRPRLTAVARRILGSTGDADDAVQEAWIRLSRSDADAIDDLGAWLTTVVSRVCLNTLQARRSRPQPAGEDLPEPPAPTEAEPEQEVLLADSVGLALLVVLDTLGPAERVAFVLHDLFGVPFDDIAPIVGRSPAAARQLASRARRRVRGEDPDDTADRVRHAELVEAFLAAAREGEFERLLGLLDPDIALRADAAATALGVAPELHGIGPVAAFARRARGATPALLDGRAAIAWLPEGELRVVYAFETDGERITGIELIAEPDRLAELDLVIVGDG